MMIFGVVTAEITKEFAEALRSHDRRKVFEDVVTRSGVTLYMSDDKEDIRIQGLWKSVKDAHDLLENEYADYLGLPTRSKGDGCGQKPVGISKSKRISSLAASKSWSVAKSEDVSELPEGAIRVSEKPSKSAWKHLKKWPKAPEPVVIIEGATAGVGSTSDLLSSGNKEDIRKAIEAVSTNPPSQVDNSTPLMLNGQHACENSTQLIANSYENNNTNLVSEETLPPQPENIDTPKSEEKSVIKIPEPTVIHDDYEEDNDDGGHHSDNDVDENNSDQAKPTNETKDISEKETKALTDDTISKEKSEPEVNENSDEETIVKLKVPVERVQSGPQTRGNKRKAGRPRKIPIKVPLSEGEIEDDSGSEYKPVLKRSRRKRRAPVRKSVRKRNFTKRQGVVPLSDEPLIKRKRGRPRKTEPTVVALNCADCDFVAKNKIHLRKHKQRFHAGSETGCFKCPVCEKQFSFDKDMKRHMMRHVDTRYPCDVCGKIYKDRKTMMTHKERHKDGWIAPTFNCEQCSKSFCTKYILTNHVKSEHLGIKRMFLCPTCGKSFTQKHAYLQHANVHLGIKPFVCDICSKAFAYEKSLKEHRFMHFEEKTFVCNVCTKAFRQKSALVVHAKIHKPTKDFLCSVCSKGFTQKQALLRHERVHNGEKPFACGVCGRSFSDKSIIRRHMILVHKRDSKEWKENTFEDKKERSDYFVTPKLLCDLVEPPVQIADLSTLPPNATRHIPGQPNPVSPPPPTVATSEQQRDEHHVHVAPVPLETVPISPAQTPARLPSVPLSMVPQSNLAPMPMHSEENLHPAHSGMPPMSHGGPLFNPRDIHELRDIRDIRELQDIRDVRAPDMRNIEMHLRDQHMRQDVRELQPADMRDMRTPDVRDLRVPLIRDHNKVSSLTDLRDMRMSDMRDMRVTDHMRDLRPNHVDMRDMRDISRDGHMSVPPLPSPGQDLAPVTTHSVGELSSGQVLLNTSSAAYPSSIPAGISSHHGVYPSTVTSPSPMPIHHYPYMYGNIPQNYDPHSGSYVQQPQMNYYQ